MPLVQATNPTASQPTPPDSVRILQWAWAGTASSSKRDRVWRGALRSVSWCRFSGGAMIDFLARLIALSLLPAYAACALYFLADCVGALTGVLP